MTPLLEVTGLSKQYVTRRGWLRAPHTVRAVEDVSFTITAGETFALVGESGSGKSTIGRCVLRLTEPSGGTVRFDGEDVLAFPPRRMRAARRDMQMAFQDP